MKSYEHRWAPFLVLTLAAAWVWASGARAQDGSSGVTSFTVLQRDPGSELTYTVPIHYGSFADVEIGPTGDGTVQLELTVLRDGAIRDRRIDVLNPGRVELATNLLGVDDLLEIGSPLLVRIEASDPITAILVRRD